MTTVDRSKRDALLDELESIRTLLGDDDDHAGSGGAPVLSDEDIPLLLPETLLPDDDIPVLLPSDDDLSALDDIPVLSAVDDDFIPVLEPEIPLLNTAVLLPETRPAPVTPPQLSARLSDTVNPAEAIRAAAARVAANATRHRPVATPPVITPPSVLTAPETSPVATASVTKTSVAESLPMFSEETLATAVPMFADETPAPSLPQAETSKTELEPAQHAAALTERVVRELMPVLEKELRRILQETL